MASSFKDRLFRAVRANMNDVLDRVREFEEEGGFGALFDQLEEEFEEKTGSSSENESRRRETEKPKSSNDKTIREYYANLEVEYGADMETVKKSYRRLMQKYHPDRYANDPEMEKLATELSQELSQAYKAIKAYHKHGK